MNTLLRPLDIEAVAQPLAQHASRPDWHALLRFLTCGSVDDGKSTLIGRLLFEAGAVPDDQLASLDTDSDRHGTTGGRDYALLVDGLAAEREQGITIDVAYRYFSTATRSFIVADTPGHEQYTRNMATGASTTDLAVILIDASKGVLPQTRRHAYIVAMLGIRHVVLAINKMDLVTYAEGRFRAVETEARAALSSLGFAEIVAIPLAARNGDNVASLSAHMPWYVGPTLLGHLESVAISNQTQGPFRFPVQWVNRPNAEFRGFAGVVVSGSARPGDGVKVLPSGRAAMIRRIVTADGDLADAATGEVPTLVLDREIDISRGDIIVGADDALRCATRLSARLLWMAPNPFNAARKLKLKLASAHAIVSAIDVYALVDIHTYALTPGDSLGMNAVAAVVVHLDRAIPATDHAENRVLGSFILIDAITGQTVALGIVDSRVARAHADKRGRLRRWRTLIAPSGESSRRSVVKALTWRVTGSADTFLLSWLFTQSAKLAAAISVTEVLTKLVLYYAHERAWARSRFGITPSARTDAANNTDGAGI